MLSAALLLAAASGDEKIFFSRHFPRSVPEYFDVTVDSGGAVFYRESSDEEPVGVQIGRQEAARLFDLARQLDYFRRDLASKRKVASTGQKILRYSGPGGARGEALFDYTEDKTAQELVEWFTHLAGTERHFFELERTLRFDRLGVNKAVMSFQSSYDKGRIIAPGQFLSILRKIVAKKKIVNLARARAASLIQRIEAAPADHSK